jgi:RNA polymerase sigma factor (sigma-70 family)
MSDLSDQQLIVQYFKGDRPALEVLIGRYLQTVYSFAYSYVKDSADAEDVTQEVFVKVWKNLQQFDQARSFKNWLLTITKYTAIDWCRKKKLIPFSEFDDPAGVNQLLETLADPRPLASDLFDGQNLADRLATALGKLLPKYQLVFALRHNEQLTFQEIAAVSGESINTVKSRYHRAVQQLRQLLGE